MTPRSRIYVAGGETLLGRALVERLQTTGHGHLVGLPAEEPDLTDRKAVDAFFADAQPDVVFLTAGNSGGIEINRNAPADLLLDNMLVSAHVLDAAFRHGVNKLLFLGSSCMYPRLAPQPLKPWSLGSGPLEPTSASYATGKLAGLALCQAYRRQHGAPFITGIPANAFGAHDDFSSESGHVIPALMRRMHEAKRREQTSLEVWGTGLPRREFIYAPDLADACIFAMRHYDAIEPINLGSGQEVSIAELAEVIAEVVGFRGEIRFDRTKPDGAPRKSLDSNVLFGVGWRPATTLRAALAATYDWLVGSPHIPCAKIPHAERADYTAEASHACTAL